MPEGDDRLESWKEIAAYLGREVRTVQLWEKSEGLPIHRHQHARQGSVYALKSELEAWRAARNTPPAAAAPVRHWRIAAAVMILALISVGGAFSFWRSRSGPITPPSSIAVLPFLDLSPQKDSEYFTDGLTEEIIDALSRVPNLRVVARTSSFAFKGKNADIREIGRQLNVTAVIEGSVRKSGDRLRITAQLNRVSDGYHLWSRTYDRQLRDVFAVQRDISEAIAAELRAGPASQPRREPTHDLEAYRLYQEARYLFNKFEPPGSNFKAIEHYRQAIARDPQFAAAWAGIADAYSYLAENLVLPPREVMPKAKEAAEKALELDDSSAEAHTSLGIVKLDYERDIEGGRREFVRAMQLNPGFAWARHWYAHTYEAENRVDDALRNMSAALDLDPLSVPISWDTAGELIILKRYDEALQRIDKSIELFPGVPVFPYMKVVANWRRGNTADARAMIAELRKQPDLAKDPSFLALFAAEDAREGHIAQAREGISALTRMGKTQYVDPFVFLEPCKALNDRAQVLLWLQRADQEHSSFFVYLHAYAPFWGLDQADLAEFQRRQVRE